MVFSSKDDVLAPAVGASLIADTVIVMVAGDVELAVPSLTQKSKVAVSAFLPSGMYFNLPELSSANVTSLSVVIAVPSNFKSPFMVKELKSTVIFCNVSPLSTSLKEKSLATKVFVVFSSKDDVLAPAVGASLVPVTMKFKISVEVAPSRSLAVTV